MISGHSGRYPKKSQVGVWMYGLTKRVMSIKTIYSEFSIKTIQWDWDKFFAASVCIGTARKENLDQFHLDI